MNRLLFSCMAIVWTLLSFAQDKPDSTVVLDLAEDTTQVTTINDIVEVQEIITSRNYNAAHFSKVWSLNSFLNLDYNLTARLKPNKPIDLGYNNGEVPEFKSDWGVSLQLGKNYRLHKYPIINMIQFNIDYSYIDLNVNHYKAAEGNKLYDSSQKNNKDYYYIPWLLEKYEVNYGMTVGPSVTIAPFIYMDIPQLHYLKFNVYGHIGYHASLLYISNDKKDINNDKKGIYDAAEIPDNSNISDNPVRSTLKLNLGHGLIYGFGFNVSWKSIGLGYELRNGALNYQSLNHNIFGPDKYKFKTTTSRIYLQIRY